MSKKLFLAAASLAIATPAWADNADAAIKLCYGQGGIMSICVMKHSDESWALSVAKSVIDRCDKLEEGMAVLWIARNLGNRREEFQKCAAERAYIKQRWSY